ncbi:MAG: hypothetical protein FJZ58_03200 [Chlamydiae bacterium]|nr:hypothetical protein [Chlamydiota bacterium]
MATPAVLPTVNPQVHQNLDVIQGQYRTLACCRNAFAGISLMYIVALTLQNFFQGKKYEAIATGLAIPLLVASYYYSKQYGDIVAITRTFARNMEQLDGAVNAHARCIDQLRRITSRTEQRLQVQNAEDESRLLITNIRRLIGEVREEMQRKQSEEEV